MSREKDLTEQRFGRLVAIKKTGRYVSPHGTTATIWLCQCDCGNTKEVITSGLTTGHVKSCGCYQIEARFTHKLTHHKLYWVYQGMKDRCYRTNNKHFSNYGGRGIKVCDEWLEDFVVLFIPYSIWRFVRLCFKPVRPDVMVYLKDTYVKRLFGNIYFCYDKKAKNWLNKIFLFRYKSS